MREKLETRVRLSGRERVIQLCKKLQAKTCSCGGKVKDTRQ